MDHTTLILYSEIFSSKEVLNYCKKKIENQLNEGISFGLITMVPMKSKASKDTVRDYKEWMNIVRPLFIKQCYGHAIISKDKVVPACFLKNIETFIGCQCGAFNELDEAILWLQRQKKAAH